MELARALGWAVVDLDLYGGDIPPGPPPQAAFFDCLPGHPFIRKLRKAGCTVVRLGRWPHPLDGRVPAAVEDTAIAGRMAAEHLAQRNFRHLGYVDYAPIEHNRRMYEAFRARALELGCECHLLAYEPLVGSTYAGMTALDKMRLRRDELREWIMRVPKPIGLFGCNAVGRARSYTPISCSGSSFTPSDASRVQSSVLSQMRIFGAQDFAMPFRPAYGILGRQWGG